MKLNKYHRPSRIVFFIVVILIIIIANDFFRSQSKVTINKNQFENEHDGNQQTWELPDKLDEISGIFFLNDQKIACIQDESSEIYIYDLDKKQLDVIDLFDKKGDFEDIAYANRKFYVLRSDGLIVEVNTALKEIYEYKIDTGAKDNEALTYDKVTKALLIVPKSDIKQKKDTKFIYLFNLKTKQLDQKPLFTIEVESVRDYLKKQDVFDKKIDFRPSAVAVHPVNGNIFLLSAEDYLLLEFNRQGIILQAIELDQSIYPQAEGLSFDSNANLYISNEKNNKKHATLIRSFTQ